MKFRTVSVDFQLHSRALGQSGLSRGLQSGFGSRTGLSRGLQSGFGSQPELSRDLQSRFGSHSERSPDSGQVRAVQRGPDCFLI